MRRKDAVLLSFFSGTLLITTIITTFAILLPHEDPNHSIIDWEEIVLALPVFRLCMMLILGLVFVATDVMILRKFRVNYLFIFELDPHYKITHVQLYRVSMMLFTIFMLCFMA
jgi:EXS family